MFSQEPENPYFLECITIFKDSPNVEGGLTDPLSILVYKVN